MSQIDIGVCLVLMGVFILGFAFRQFILLFTGR